MRVPDAVLKWTSVVEKNRHREVPTSLVLAMIWQETSNGDRYAYRYEPGYLYFFDYKRKAPLYAAFKTDEANREFALKELGPTEFHAQSASFGLLQVMGAVAREYGFGGSILALSDPELNVRLGTKYLWLYGHRNGKLSIAEALKRYNGSQVYSDEVLEKYAVIT